MKRLHLASLVATLLGLLGRDSDIPPVAGEARGRRYPAKLGIPRNAKTSEAVVLPERFDKEVLVGSGAGGSDSAGGHLTSFA